MSYQQRGTGRVVHIGAVKIRLQLEEDERGNQRVSYVLDGKHMMWPADADPSRGLIIRRAE